MKTSIKKWAGLGLATAFVGTSIVACSPAEEAGGDGAEATATGKMGAGEGGEGEGGEGEGGEGEGGESGMAQLPLPKRLAFMAGHVEAGLALYRAGELEMAAPHLLHPVSETHEAERKGLEDLGFDASLFETVSTALEEGKPASEIEGQLKAAEENIAEVTKKAGGDTADIINYLMDTVVEEYTVAITDGKVSDPGEYQDAFGFAKVALARADSLDPSDAEKIKSEINALIEMWPDAPIPPDDPSPVGQISAQASKVKLALPSS
ncbi:hypothetical protein GCM10009096_21810 [Parasphingorhabdus litoris]|uniref:DUF305 domain-containing protein n=1 Tax=Parasphingorhabdus litoris TaxID=394733 RepID=A0ABN1ALD8_9SPHN|nr:hypothetical protein [Parasphingorhabdus litoris]